EPTKKKSSSKKSTAKKSTVKKSTAKKSTAKKSTAKKSTAKKSTEKKSTAKKSSSKKLTADSSSKKKKTRRELAQETTTSSGDEYSDDYIDPDAAERGDEPKSVVTHLDEFRSRLMYSLLAIIIVSLGSFFFSEYILDFINRPYLATGYKLNVFNLTEGFILRLKAAFIAGIFVGLPVIVYHLWRYILPAINKQDRKFARLSIIAAIILLYGGMAFTYFFILPFAVKMLLSFTPVEMTNTIGASKYLSFVLLFSLGMGIMFELPIIIMILTRIGIVSPAFLISKRKYAIILLWIISAMITPPDVLTQSMIAVPLMLLYELSIIISKMMVKRKKKKELEKLTS
ncbi:MAG: twin-arginine translocase subunit TatC, partial [bacterium]